MPRMTHIILSNSQSLNQINQYTLSFFDLNKLNKNICYHKLKGF